MGVIGFVRIAIWQQLHWANYGMKGTGEYWYLTALTVSLSLVGIVLWGTLSGSMIPMILKRLKLDPATSSAPFVATLVDVTGLIIYFSFAAIILRGTLLNSNNKAPLLATHSGNMTVITLATAPPVNAGQAPIFINDSTVRVPISTSTKVLWNKFRTGGCYRNDDYRLTIAPDMTFYDVVLTGQVKNYVIVYPAAGNQWSTLVHPVKPTK